MPAFLFFILSISHFTTKNEPYELLTEKWKNEILEQIDVKNRQWGALIDGEFN
ncbi:hypothetical protein BSBH6_03257 [Bacillus subtilis]|nr:hypothetical protein BSBH6_03257 [Bacillus subtilis]RPK22452.1 hypothetical protein BH5_03263 [Bacillus subtilis]